MVSWEIKEKIERVECEKREHKKVSEKKIGNASSFSFETDLNKKVFSELSIVS